MTDILKRKQIIYIPQGPRGYSPFDRFTYVSPTIAGTLSYEITESHKFSTLVLYPTTISSIELIVSSISDKFVMDIINSNNDFYNITAISATYNIHDGLIIPNVLYRLLKYDSSNIVLG